MRPAPSGHHRSPKPACNGNRSVPDAGGHDQQTANTMVCVESRQRCAGILSNDVRSEAGFADLVKFILGDTGVPYDWKYGDNGEVIAVKRLNYSLDA